MKRKTAKARAEERGLEQAHKAALEAKATLDLGWSYWSREFSKRRQNAQDTAKPIEVRQQAFRAMNDALKACNACGDKPAELMSPEERQAAHVKYNS